MIPPLTCITGASSGIGAAFARHYAAAGYDLILTGRRREKLEAVAAECRARGAASVEIILAELSDRDALINLSRTLAGRDIGILVNNAGYGHDKSFLDDTVESQVAMLTVHAEATVRLTHAVLPLMRRRGSGDIITVSSVAAVLPTPGGELYAGTKAFLNAFSESLHLETGHQGIRVQTLCPGFTHTDFHERIGIPRERQTSRFPRLWMEPDEIVRSSLRALDRGQVVCVPGLLYKLIFLAAGIVPRPLYYRLLRRRKFRGRRL
jgi:short-subunit dehydrogenase